VIRCICDWNISHGVWVLLDTSMRIGKEQPKCILRANKRLAISGSSRNRL